MKAVEVMMKLRFFKGAKTKEIKKGGSGERT
jgi:hypothetical protein